MKKKFLSLLIACLTVFGFSFAFTACKDNPKGKMTEEEWKQAIENTNNSLNFTMTKNYKRTATLNDQVIFVYGIDHTDQFDATNNYNIHVVGTEYGYDYIGGEELGFSYEIFRELSGTDLISYEIIYLLNSSWEKLIKSFDTQVEANAAFLEYGLGGFDVENIRQDESSTDKLSLLDAYSLFAFNSKFGIYESNICIDNDFDLTNYDVTIEFKDGKIYKIVKSRLRVDSDGTIIEEIETDTYTYDDVEITIPEEVRNTAQEIE